MRIERWMQAEPAAMSGRVLYLSSGAAPHEVKGELDQGADFIELEDRPPGRDVGDLCSRDEARRVGCDERFPSLREASRTRSPCDRCGGALELGARPERYLASLADR